MPGRGIYPRRGPGVYAPTRRDILRDRRTQARWMDTNVRLDDVRGLGVPQPDLVDDRTSEMCAHPPSYLPPRGTPSPVEGPSKLSPPVAKRSFSSSFGSQDSFLPPSLLVAPGKHPSSQPVPAPRKRTPPASPEDLATSISGKSSHLPTTSSPPISPRRPVSYAAAVGKSSAPSVLTAPLASSPLPTTNVTPKTKAYPPIVVEKLPDWSTHFYQLKSILGHAPNARPFNKGFRFLPKSGTEYKATVRYLVSLSRNGQDVSWHAYSSEKRKPVKVGIRGLPADTPVGRIAGAMEELGFPLVHVRHIPGRRGSAGCLFFAELKFRPSLSELEKLYKTDELLNMPGVRIEGWRARAGPAQCFRCQGFGHSSVLCYNPPKCVKCSGSHFADACLKPKETPPTCVNCNRAHTANDRRCPVFRKIARKMGAHIPPPIPPSRVAQTDKTVVQPVMVEEYATTGSTLAPPANLPTAPVAAKTRRRRRKPKSAKPTVGVEQMERPESQQAVSGAVEIPPPPVKIIPPPRRPITSQKSQRPLPQSTVEVVRISIAALQGAVEAVALGQDPLPSLLEGLDRLTSIVRGLMSNAAP